MMKKSFLVALCAALLTGCCCASRHSAGTQSATTASETAATTSRDSLSSTSVLCGGYSKQREPTAPELALFKKVMQEQDGVSYKPMSVATQVVAGCNYRFVCEAVTATREIHRYKAEVIIYQPLPGHGEARITAINKL